MARILPCGLLAATMIAGTAHAARTDFTGTLDMRAGYGSNPYLSSGGSKGSVLFGGTLSAGVTSSAALSTTTLSGVIDVEQNVKRYGRNENYSVSLGRSQRLSERLSLDAGVSYQNTINPGVSYQNTLTSGAIFQNSVISTPVVAIPGDAAAITAIPVTTIPVGSFDPSNLDLFTIGQRSQRYSGNAGLTWTPTARDQFTLGGNASRTHYKSFNGNYTQYGGSVGYLHTLNENTRIGMNGTFSDVESESYPSAQSYGINAVLVQKLSARWMLNASVGGILPRGAAQGGSVTLGFTLSACGNYGRSVVCFTASRQSAPTGIGGLRTDLQGGFTLSYALSEHDRLNGGANVDHSGSGRIVPRQNYYQASAGYSHDISSRISVGGSGRYQHRGGNGFYGAATGYAVTVDVITRFGHVGR